MEGIELYYETVDSEVNIMIRLDTCHLDIPMYFGHKIIFRHTDIFFSTKFGETRDLQIYD